MQPQYFSNPLVLILFKRDSDVRVTGQFYLCLRHWCFTQISAFSIDWVHVVAIPNQKLIIAYFTSPVLVKVNNVSSVILASLFTLCTLGHATGAKAGSKVNLQFMRSGCGTWRPPLLNDIPPAESLALSKEHSHGHIKRTCGEGEVSPCH